jgi:2'-5' RNA ligase
MFTFAPPAELANKIHSIRKEFSKQFDSHKALKPPVHITLFDPFQIPIDLSSGFERYISRLQHWASGQLPFKIDLRNFNFFSSPQQPVVYVDVVRSLRIINFRSSFIHELAKYHLTDTGSGSYKPHITIGYRDVTSEAFPAIKNYYSKQTFSSSFVCDSFYLWKHDGKNWQVVQTFFLNGKGEQLALF